MSVISSINFKFPSDVLKWMKQNAAPKMALKLMQVCKYFQHKKFPYFVIKSFEINGNNAAYILLKSDTEEIVQVHDIPKRLWILDQLVIDTVNFSLKGIAVCEVKKLQLIKEILSLNEFKFLVTNVVDLSMEECGIENENGDLIALEDMLEFLPKIKCISLTPCFFTIADVEKADSLLLPESLQFRMTICENFNLQSFTSFLLKRQNIHVNISVESRIPIKDEIRFRIKLQDFVDEIIKHWSIKYRPPNISFLMQTESSKQCLKDLAVQHWHEKGYNTGMKN